jgi:hypothetical protein
MKTLAMIVGLALELGACVVVEDHPHRAPECSDGDLACSNDDTVDTCVNGTWEILDDCWDVCNGPATCGYDQYGDPICVCQ